MILGLNKGCSAVLLSIPQPLNQLANYILIDGQFSSLAHFSYTFVCNARSASMILTDVLSGHPGDIPKLSPLPCLPLPYLTCNGPQSDMSSTSLAPNDLTLSSLIIFSLLTSLL